MINDYRNLTCIVADPKTSVFQIARNQLHFPTFIKEANTFSTRDIGYYHALGRKCDSISDAECDQRIDAAALEQGVDDLDRNFLTDAQTGIEFAACAQLEVDCNSAADIHCPPPEESLLDLGGEKYHWGRNCFTQWYEKGGAKRCYCHNVGSVVLQAVSVRILVNC